MEIIILSRQLSIEVVLSDIFYGKTRLNRISLWIIIPKIKLGAMGMLLKVQKSLADKEIFKTKNNMKWQNYIGCSLWKMNVTKKRRTKKRLLWCSFFVVDKLDLCVPVSCILYSSIENEEIFTAFLLEVPTKLLFFRFQFIFLILPVWETLFAQQI